MQLNKKLLAALIVVAVMTLPSIGHPVSADPVMEPCVYQGPISKGGTPQSSITEFSLPPGTFFNVQVDSFNGYNELFYVELDGPGDHPTVYYSGTFDLYDGGPGHQPIWQHHDRTGGTSPSVPVHFVVSAPDHMTVLPSLVISVPQGTCDQPGRDSIGSRNGAVASNGQGGDPVNTGTGNFEYHPKVTAESALLMPTYNSMDVWGPPAPTGVFGPNWSSLLDVALTPVPSSSDLYLRLSTGTVLRFASSGANTWTPPGQLQAANLVRDVISGAFTLTYLDGSVLQFDSSMRITSTLSAFGAGMEVTRSAGGDPTLTLVRTKVDGHYGRAWSVYDDAPASGLADRVVGPYDPALTVPAAGTPVIQASYDTSNRLTGLSAPYPLGATSLGGEVYAYSTNLADRLSTVTQQRGAGLAPVAIVANGRDFFHCLGSTVPGYRTIEHFTQWLFGNSNTFDESSPSCGAGRTYGVALQAANAAVDAAAAPSAFADSPTPLTSAEMGLDSASTPEQSAMDSALSEGRVKAGAPLNHLNGAMAEELGWRQSLSRGEIGIQGPGKLTTHGPDYITYDPIADEVVVWDSKYSSSGRFPSGSIPGSKMTAWSSSVSDAVGGYSGPGASEAQRALQAGRVVGRYFQYKG
jgi:hypothetical protein